MFYQNIGKYSKYRNCMRNINIVCLRMLFHQTNARSFERFTILLYFQFVVLCPYWISIHFSISIPSNQQHEGIEKKSKKKKRNRNRFWMWLRLTSMFVCWCVCVCLLMLLALPQAIMAWIWLCSILHRFRFCAGFLLCYTYSIWEENGNKEKLQRYAIDFEYIVAPVWNLIGI